MHLRPALLLALCTLTHGSLQAQSAGFAAGGRELFVLDLASVPVDEFPKQIQLLSGDIRAVDKFGKRMLRASDPAAFLIELSEELPQDFTLEFDIVPKVGCNLEDIAFEGTAEINQGEGSMNVLWQSSHVALIGGADNNKEVPIPEDLKAKVQGNVTEVRASFSGTSFTLYTNGKQIVSASGRKFVRGRLLRVFLGGADAMMCSVHLAKLRVAAR